MASLRKKRRRLSMTSLIDVIFLLLLFFMLTSTFSKFSEVELSAAGSGASVFSDSPPLFIKLGHDQISLNGNDVALAAIQTSMLNEVAEGTTLLISLELGVHAQRLTDLLVALRTMPNLRVTVLGS